ncbi:hypothetical protein M440DRAFT_1390763 [Trichoderma longibrachiatum ATCC 18648]|uniref:Uncharacterized protein n=1 Tax=Trichoderma longibrachiatum ATCC 18648 TaxID=983965 RepID=A0A2T4C7A0_TRILO|nr:hypothetical protein M440DRAFT_1390763 [Trichoderma longibrachiatum ATCC 18648]
MPKPRTKRGAARDERKRKHSDTAKSNSHENKRQRRDDDQGDYNNDNTTDYNTHDAAAYGGESNYEHHGGPGGEREFFGMLADDEQEYFRRADEMLELNQFPTPEDRDYGHNLVNAIAEIPSKGKDWSIPQHIKDKVMTALAAHESQLRESWMGRSVWRTWKGDMWKTRRFDWKNWMKELDEMKAPAAAAPKNKGDVKGNNDERRTAKDEEDVEQKDAQPDEAPEDVNGHGNGDGHEEDASTRKEKKKDKKSKKEKKEKKKEAEEAEEGGEPQEKKKKKRKEKNKSKDGDVEMADAEE